MTRMTTALYERLETERIRHRIPGMAGLVRWQDGVVDFVNWGSCDRHGQVPVDAKTLFGIASLTKTFTATALLQLAAAGRIDLDDRLVEFFPAFAAVIPDAGRVRLQHLLSHASGLPEYSRAFNLATKWNSYTPAQQRRFRAEEGAIGPPMETVDDLLAAMGREGRAPVGRPGQRFQYSNEGFALIGHVIEAVSGQAYEEYLREHVFAPCLMTRSRVAVPDAAAGAVTELFEPDVDGNPVCIPAWPQAPATLADGFVRTTTEDLARYLEAFVEVGRSGPALLPASWRHRMETPRIIIGEGSTAGPWYGLGWYLDRYAGARRMYHTGDMSGVSSYMAVLPEYGIAVALLSNVTGAPAAELGTVLLELAWGGGS